MAACGAVDCLGGTESEAEARLDDMRLGIRTDIAKALLTFPNQTVSHWPRSRIFALCSPRGYLPADEEPLVLPPLRPLKDYQRAVRSSTPEAVRVHRARRLKAPCSSALGMTAGPEFWAEDVPAVTHLSPNLECTAAAVARRRIVLARRREKEIEEDRLMGGQPALGSRSKTICLSKNSPPAKVRGIDPFAGGLFSRNAKLDPLARHRGIYSSAIYHKRKDMGAPHTTR